MSRTLEMLLGSKEDLYEFGTFADPAGDWLVVHAMSPQGNSDVALVTAQAHREFGAFDAVMFVGVAGSLKDDIRIGDVIVGDYVYNAQSAKVEDEKILARPHALTPARELLAAARWLIYRNEWQSLIRPPNGMEELPKREKPPGCCAHASFRNFRTWIDPPVQAEIKLAQPPT